MRRPVFLRAPFLHCLLGIIASGFTPFGLHSAPTAAEPPPPDLPDGLYAEIATPRGPIIAELFFADAPLTVANFVGLAEGTLGPAPKKPFYDGLTFHRVVSDFVIQGGDPLGTGAGGPGYEFADEFVSHLRHDAAGILSMANAGPDTNGSQFFVTLAPLRRLDRRHSVFGRVVQGLEVLPKIQPGDTITSITIRRIGAAAHAFQVDEDTFTDLLDATPRARPRRFEDVDHLLTENPPHAQHLNHRLARLARANGPDLYARVFARFTPQSPAQRPGNFTVALAKKLQLSPHTILAVYFADVDQWGLWIGDARLADFIGRPGTVREFTRSGELHEAKQSFLASAAAQADAAIAESEQRSPAQPLTAAQKNNVRVDAVLDALLLKFEP